MKTHQEIGNIIKALHRQFPDMDFLLMAKNSRDTETKGNLSVGKQTALPTKLPSLGLKLQSKSSKNNNGPHTKSWVFNFLSENPRF